MVEPTPRFRRRLNADFGQEAQRLAAELEQLPESINSGQDPERIQASVLRLCQGHETTAR